MSPFFEVSKIHFQDCNITIFLYYVQYKLILIIFGHSINLKLFIMLKRILIFSIIVTASFNIYAQEKIVIENNPDYEFQSEKNKTTTQTVVVQNTKPIFQPTISFGGNIGLSFWNGGANILIAPKAYYHFSPKIFTGVGLTYMYAKNSSYYNSDYYDYSSNSFGGSAMIGYRPMRFLQFTVEYEGLNTNYKNYYTNDSFWNNGLYLGASFITGHVAFGFQFDVLHSSTSPYYSAWTPVISFYF